MASRYQEGSLKQHNSKQGKVWKLRYFGTRATDGKWVEQTPLVVGLVKDFPTEKKARAEAVAKGLIERINQSQQIGRVTFGRMARQYIEVALSPKAMKPLASTSIYTIKLNINNYLLPRWEERVAVEIETLEVEEWLQSLSVDRKADGLEWETLKKIQRTMADIYTHAKKHGLIPKDAKFDPMLLVDTKASSSNYVPLVLAPEETFKILNSLPLLQRTMVVLDAATGLRYSEIAGLRWMDVNWDDHCINIKRRWIRGDIDGPKTKASKAAVALSPVLSHYLSAWRKQTTYAKDTDWVFSSVKTKGRTPRVGNMLVRDYLYPAAVNAGVLTKQTTLVKELDKKTGKAVDVEKTRFFDKKGNPVKRFGFHSFRHSLSSFLTVKGKLDPKTAQAALRHANVSTTLNLYTQTDSDELQAAQSLMLDAIFSAENGHVQ